MTIVLIIENYSIKSLYYSNELYSLFPPLGFISNSRDYLLQDYSPDKDVRRQHIAIVESFAGLISIANFDLKNIFVLFTQEICKISGKICGHIAAIVGPSSPDIDND